jgi:putative copper resistance protein D
MTFLFAAIRALHFASLMTAFGASALLSQTTIRTNLRKPLAIAASVALVTAVLCLCFATAEMTGDPDAFYDIQSISIVATQTFYGQVFFLRLTLLIALGLVSLGDRAQIFKAAIAGTALALLGLTSHAAAAGPPQYEYVRAGIDALHLIAAGFWVGGLAVLAPEVLARPRNTARLVTLLRRFSRWGVVSVAVLLIAGTVNAVLILDTHGMRWNGTYVTLLAIKIVLAAVMVALALTNRFSVLPALARGDQEASDTIPLTVLAELGAALLILAIVGFLGLTAPMQM